ncbi:MULTISPECIES: hypothetical protein [Rhizobium]|uniref:Uncharacterized protein n=1 Tax=Rhizobium rhododendri TaxID=2506430 RepID=A0ABY8ID85_9HYPH|nr:MULTISPECIES: hypothetical protein [Rhizobium]MBO9099181.1 hypothetical protein [Rhizobium sp. L58/93]MBO9132013.1 hypothetical protein [Rhizobium sp. B209b/85]MBO9169443.1 hypothetical protein [Rhizobium sp. L245/93]MBO9185394.1 hypothetical protein [Rhizobium sp. E27B/91]MBZ5758816.1 hypothetical protein [Rhizobium sp. VS19-DR96]
MTDSSDSVNMIGLHRLAPTGEGGAAVPEISALMARRGTAAHAPDVIVFPREAARPPGEVPVAAFGRDAATGRNVVAFAAASGKHRRYSSKA